MLAAVGVERDHAAGKELRRCVLQLWAGKEGIAWVSIEGREKNACSVHGRALLVPATLRGRAGNRAASRCELP